MIERRTRLYTFVRRNFDSGMRHWPQLAVVCALFAFALPVFADTQQEGQAYRLAPGDRIVVTVVGQPDLSGEMTIDGSGDIVLPFTGPIRAEDLTPAECQNLIRDRLADGYLKQPVVSVRISEPRPVYVLGDVRTPGAYPFRYGSTVKSAVALAGGFGVAGALQSTAFSEFLASEERLRELAHEQVALRIREARLEAQRDDKDTFSPPDLPSVLNQKEFADLVAGERATLAGQAAVLKEEVQLLNSQKPRLQQEITATNAQIGNANERVGFMKSEVSRSTDLVKHGLGVHGSEVQLRIQQANEESNLWRLTAQLSRLQRDMGDLDIKIAETAGSFKNHVLAELDKARQRLAELKVALPAAQQIHDFKWLQAGSTAMPNAARSIHVTRARHRQTAVLEGSEDTPLQPGDVVEIKNIGSGQGRNHLSPAS